MGVPPLPCNTLRRISSENASPPVTVYEVCSAIKLSSPIRLKDNNGASSASTRSSHSNAPNSIVDTTAEHHHHHHHHHHIMYSSGWGIIRRVGHGCMIRFRMSCSKSSWPRAHYCHYVGLLHTGDGVPNSLPVIPIESTLGACSDRGSTFSENMFLADGGSLAQYRSNLVSFFFNIFLLLYPSHKSFRRLHYVCTFVS